MGRIRTIKPEFPQSESMGRISRDARLLFILLWTLVDDSGRTRAASRMLASLLYPYDDDAPGLMDGWLAELEREGCLTVYLVDGQTYLEVSKWNKHQKIDRPSKSKFPDIREGSSNTREDSRGLVGGSRTKDQGPRTKEGDAGAPPGTTSNGHPPNWVAQIRDELIQVGACSYAQVGKLCQDLHGVHGDLLVQAAGAYRRAKLTEGVRGAKYSKRNVAADFAAMAGVYVDHIKPGFDPLGGAP